MLDLLYIIFMAVCNRARGSQLFGLTSSTTIGRLVATFGMAVFTAWLVGGSYYALSAHTALFWGLLMLWCSFAWDRYWETACAAPTLSAGWPPVDFLMSFWPTPAYQATGMNWKLRAWGTLAMGLRQLMLMPFLGLVCYLTHGNYYLLPIPILFGILYFIAGLIWPVEPSNPILPAEFAIGASIGALVLIMIGAI